MRTGRQTADDILHGRAKNWPAAATPTADLVVRLLRCSSLVLAGAVRGAKALDLTFTEFEVLVTLRGAPPPHELTPTVLYETVLLSSGGLTKVLHALAQRRLVTRAAAERDGRIKPVRLTRKGRALAERAMARVMAADETLITDALSPAERMRLIGLLRKLLAKLEPGRSGAPAKPARKDIAE